MPFTDEDLKDHKFNYKNKIAPMLAKRWWGNQNF